MSPRSRMVGILLTHSCRYPELESVCAISMPCRSSTSEPSGMVGILGEMMGRASTRTPIHMIQTASQMSALRPKNLRNIWRAERKLSGVEVIIGDILFFKRIIPKRVTKLPPCISPHLPHNLFVTFSRSSRWSEYILKTFV